MTDRFVKNPGPVSVQGVEFTLENLAKHLVDSDFRFNSNGAGIRAGLRVEDAFKGDPAVVRLTEECWKLVHEAAENPADVHGRSIGYPQLAMRDRAGNVVPIRTCARDQLPFIDAIANASTDDPSEPEPVLVAPPKLKRSRPRP